MGTRARAVSVLVVGAIAACGGGEDQPDASVPPDAFVDHAGPLFDPDRVIEVAIEIPAVDWDTLRHQNRTISTLFGDCLAMPFADPFTYFPGTATVDGTRLTNVGVRKKGFLGSLNDERPSLKLKFDEYVGGQRLLGLKTITLNNNQQDPTLIKQCLAYRTFNAAGVKAPRCNFAHVTVNGADLGVYTHVEAANKDFLRRMWTDGGGNLYEGTLSDFRVGWTGTFELKTNETANDRTDLDAVVAALELPDGQLLAALDPIVDVDQFLSFWAVETLITHYDGYTGNTNNYFVYHDPTSDRFELIPWGTDGTFNPGQSPWGGQLAAVQANSMLSRRLYLLPETRDRYIARLRALMNNAFMAGDVLAEIDRMEALIEPIANPAGIQDVRDFVSGRRAVIEAGLVGGPPAWTAPPPEPLCFATIGSASGTFQTTWGTAGAPDPFATGTGTLMGTIEGTPIQTVQVGATAGLNMDVMPPNAQIAVVAWLTNGTADLVVFETDPTQLGPNRDVTIDWSRTMGVIFNYDPHDPANPNDDTFVQVGLFADGTVHLTMAAQTGGAPVTGTFTGTVIRSPF